MVELNVLNLLKENGKTKYWLYKRLGMSYQNFNKMVNNETSSIRYFNTKHMRFSQYLYFLVIFAHN